MQTGQYTEEPIKAQSSAIQVRMANRALSPTICMVASFLQSQLLQNPNSLFSRTESRELHGKGFNGIAAAFKPYFTKQKKMVGCSGAKHSTIGLQSSGGVFSGVMSLGLAVARRTVLASLH